VLIEHLELPRIEYLLTLLVNEHVEYWWRLLFARSFIASISSRTSNTYHLISIDQLLILFTQMMLVFAAIILWPILRVLVLHCENRAQTVYTPLISIQAIIKPLALAPL
jgi:hypothetical protein